MSHSTLDPAADAAAVVDPVDASAVESFPFVPTASSPSATDSISDSWPLTLTDTVHSRSMRNASRVPLMILLNRVETERQKGERQDRSDKERGSQDASATIREEQGTRMGQSVESPLGFSVTSGSHTTCLIAATNMLICLLLQLARAPLLPLHDNCLPRM